MKLRGYAMNHKIKELLEQAGVTYAVMPKDTVYEKFAELIVRECAMLANEHLEEIEGVHFGVGRAIKNHFGVE
jgi:hypothetical protein